MFLEREKGSCGKYDQAVVRAFECELGRSSQMRWIRFTAAFVGVKSEKPAECLRYVRDRGVERVQVMNFVALRMLTGDRAKYLGLIFAIAFCTFLLENQTSIFASILKRTGSQILDVTDADVWVMDGKTEYFEQTKALKDTDLTRVRGVTGVEWAVKLFKGAPVARTRAGKFATCILLGLDDATLTGAPRKMLLGSWQRLQEPDSIVIDNAGYILLFPGEPLELDRELEMNDHKVRIVGISDASAPFLSNPVIHTRYSEAVNFVGHERTELSYVLVRSQPGVNAEEVCRRIEAQTGLRARTTRSVPCGTALSTT